MATWKDAFQESTNRRNSDFRVPVIASLKEKINRYYESTNDDITDWVQSTIDSWVSYYDDTHEDYLRATEELENACDWFSNNLYEFEDKYGYSPDEDLVCEIAQDYASSTLEYLKDTRERFEDDEDWEDEEEFEESKLRESNDDISELEKAIPEEMIGKYGYIDKQKGHIDWETQWPFDLEDLDTFTQAVINLFPSIKTITLTDRDESCPIYHITIKGKDYTVDETSWEDLPEGTEIFDESKKTDKKHLREGGDISFIFDEKAFKSSGIYDKLAEVYGNKIADIFLDWVKSPEYKDGPFVISYEWGPESAMITSPDLMNFDLASKYAELFADLRGRKGIYFHDSSPFGSLLSDKFMQRELTAIKSSKDDVKFIGDGMVLNHLNGDALDESKKTKVKRLKEDQESPEILEEIPTENEELEVKEDSLGDVLSQEEIEDINYRISHIRSEYFSLELDQDATDPGIILESLQAFRNEFSDISTTLVTVKYSEFIADALDPKTPEGYLRYLCKRLYQDLVDKLLTWAEDTWGYFAAGKFKNYDLLDLARFWDTVALVHNDLGELLVNLLGTYQNGE